MSGVYIKGMGMPETGCYFVGVDNSNGKDKTVITVLRRIGNTNDRYVFGSYELVPVPPHGRLIDADALDADLTQLDMRTGEDDAIGFSIDEIDNAPTIIPAEEGQ